MLLSDQLTPEQMRDAEALGRICEDTEAWKAMERLIARIQNDGIDRWASDDALGKKWLRGFREALSAVMPAIAQASADVKQVEDEEKHVRAVVVPKADDGQGTGDLAL